MDRKRVLIADDEPSIQAMIGLCLRKDGYETSVVSDGREALDAVRRLSPALLLLDLCMPALDGIAVLRALADQNAIPLVRVIVMTAHGSVQTAVQAIRLGASDFLEKPFKPDDLRLSVASVLDDDDNTRRRRVESYDQVLNRVRDSLRAGKLDLAEELLMRAGTISDNDPGFLNLAGVIHEAHGRRSSAKRFFQRAILAVGSYPPALQNLNRLNELEKKGTSAIPVSLGEHDAVLNWVGS
jgi:DNA-binding NtrC family response regulator